VAGKKFAREEGWLAAWRPSTVARPQTRREDGLMGCGGGEGRWAETGIRNSVQQEKNCFLFLLFISILIFNSTFKIGFGFQIQLNAQ
jgi:hypothetical protein